MQQMLCGTIKICLRPLSCLMEQMVSLSESSPLKPSKQIILLSNLKTVLIAIPLKNAYWKVSRPPIVAPAWPLCIVMAPKTITMSFWQTRLRRVPTASIGMADTLPLEPELIIILYRMHIIQASRWQIVWHRSYIKIPLHQLPA